MIITAARLKAGHAVVSCDVEELSESGRQISELAEEMLTELKKQYTIVIVTHNIAQARRISDYAAFLFGGRLVEWGKSEDLFGCPKEEETRAFLAGIYG